MSEFTKKHLLFLVIGFLTFACTVSQTIGGNQDPVDSDSVPTNTPSPTPTTSPTTVPSATPTPDLSKLTPSCFQASSSNPSHTNGTSIGNFAKWNDPSILKINNEYIMYASSPGDSTSPDYNIKIYRFTSSDKMVWTVNPSTPVLSAGTTGAWDEKSVETPSVVYFNN